MKTNFYKALFDPELIENYLDEHLRIRYLLLVLILTCNLAAIQTGLLSLIIAFYASWKFIQNEVDIRILKTIKKKRLTRESTE